MNSVKKLFGFSGKFIKILRVMLNFQSMENILMKFNSWKFLDETSQFYEFSVSETFAIFMELNRIFVKNNLPFFYKEKVFNKNLSKESPTIHPESCFS
jgi:hypothetical protein